MMIACFQAFGKVLCLSDRLIKHAMGEDKVSLCFLINIVSNEKTSLL